MSVITITKDNFSQEVLSSSKPVLLDFWASWCAPCKMLSPVVDQIAEETTDAKVGKIKLTTKNLIILFYHSSQRTFSAIEIEREIGCKYSTLSGIKK